MCFLFRKPEAELKLACAKDKTGRLPLLPPISMIVFALSPVTGRSSSKVLFTFLNLSFNNLGAVTILRQVNEIDFKLLYAGKICCDELQRVKRIARQDCVKLPHFLKDIVAYRKTLNQIALTNGLIQKIGRPLLDGNTDRKKARTKTMNCMSSDERASSRTLSCPSRARSGLQFTAPRQPRILSRRSSTYRRLCTSAASFRPSPS